MYVDELWTSCGLFHQGQSPSRNHHCRQVKMRELLLFLYRFSRGARAKSLRIWVKIYRIALDHTDDNWKCIMGVGWAWYDFVDYFLDADYDG